LDALAKAHPEYEVEKAKQRLGEKDFLLQVERARDFFRGPKYLNLKPGRDLRPRMGGYRAAWLKRQAQVDRRGSFRGWVCEAALVVAAHLDAIILMSFTGPERAVIFR
jgi:hypothetical protein